MRGTLGKDRSDLAGFEPENFKKVGMYQQSRVNIFKSFSFCTPATSRFLTVARCAEFVELNTAGR